MGKSSGSPLNPWRGRVGGQVYSYSGGEQIIRTYNGNVANPRTSLQMAHRAKVVLAGKLSALAPDAVIMGMASSKRDRRSAFSSNIINNAVATSTPTGQKAVIAPEKLLFAKGSRLDSIGAEFSVESNVAVQVSVAPAVSVDAIMVVAVEYNGSILEYSYINYGIITDFSQDETIDLSGKSLTGNVNVYCIPLTRKASAGRASGAGVSREDSGYAATLDITNPDIYDFHESLYVGTKTIAAPTP